MGKTLSRDTKKYRDKAWFLTHTHLWPEKGYMYLIHKWLPECHKSELQHQCILVNGPEQNLCTATYQKKMQTEGWASEWRQRRMLERQKKSVQHAPEIKTRSGEINRSLVTRTLLKRGRGWGSLTAARNKQSLTHHYALIVSTKQLLITDL